MCLIKYVENELLYSTVPLPKIKNKKKKEKKCRLNLLWI